MNNLTALEIKTLEEIFSENGNGEYIMENYNKREYLSILLITTPNEILRGVLSSLIKKGYISISKNEIDSIITIEKLGEEYYNKRV